MTVDGYCPTSSAKARISWFNTFKPVTPWAKRHDAKDDEEITSCPAAWILLIHGSRLY
jgi:hypothetical protein